ncbi:hypothetical protein B0H66DRAFT_91806 [Apodospora peruviana]|uniref:Uncharacterized protein n=1 Tax=Apodospora peruviana TaxID=516989 RepID=A0AAE0IU20_9PEZI|nr:hypothetical protein B0H66DRAFT_91806 [Apodospora peruviana]
MDLLPHDDTTTTEYDSGGSEGVDYVYEGQQVVAAAAQVMMKRGDSQRSRKDASPKRKIEPKGKQRRSSRSSPTQQCICGAATQKASDDGESTTALDEEEDDDTGIDTDDEGGTKKRICNVNGPPTKPHLSGPEDAEGQQQCCSDRKKKAGKKKSATSGKRSSGRRSPYIEEYPDEPRPVILLKEHKLPRRFSSAGSEEKLQRGIGGVVRDPVEEHLMASSLGRAQTMMQMGKRPPWVSTHQAMRTPDQLQHPEQHRQRRRRDFRYEVLPGGHRFSGSDMEDDSDFESGGEHQPTGAGPSTPRRRPSHHYQATTGVETVTARSSVWKHSSSPKYSSSWPMQHGSHYPAPPAVDPARQRAPRRRHHNHRDRPDDHLGYESGDESEDIFDGEFEFDENTHQIRRPARPPHQREERAAHSASSSSPTGRTQRRHHHHHRQVPAPTPAPAALEQPLHHSHDDPDEPRATRPRRVRPPRPPIARTVVTSRPSMAAMDQGRSRTSVATELCDIWRGRPEDWESPYSSSGCDESDDDPTHAQMLLLEGTPPARASSPQLLPPSMRRSTDMSHFSVRGGRTRSPSPVLCGPRRTRTWDAGDERYFLLDAAPTVPSVRGGGGGGGRRRDPSRCPTERSRWTMMAPPPMDDYFEDYEMMDEEEEEQDYCYGFAPLFVSAPSPPWGSTSSPPPLRSRRAPFSSPSPPRETRELILAPMPTRMAAARFNFDKSYTELSRALL